MKKFDQTTQLFEIPFFSNDKFQLLSELRKKIENSSKLSYIVTPNPEQIVLSRRNKKFFSLIKRADYIIPDGVGIILAAKFLLDKKETNLVKRIPGRELVIDLLRLSQENKWKVLVIGGQNYHLSPQVKATKNQFFYHLEHQLFQFAWTPGFADINSQSEIEAQQLATVITKLQPDIVFVAFGAPKQEEWLFANQELLQKVNVKVAMAVGGSFDSLLKLVPSTPGWIAKFGFEWLFRLITQPWRWRRQLSLISFLGIVLLEKKNNPS